MSESPRQVHSVEMKGGPEDVVIKFIDHKGKDSVDLEYQLEGSPKDQTEANELIHTGAKNAEEITLTVTPRVAKEESQGGATTNQLQNLELRFVDEKGAGMGHVTFVNHSSSKDGDAKEARAGEIVNTGLTSTENLSLEVVSKEEVRQDAGQLEKEDQSEGGTIVSLIDGAGHPLPGIRYKALEDDKSKEGKTGSGGTVSLSASPEDVVLELT